MHPYDFNLIRCLHNIDPYLPREIRQKIYDLTKETRKEWKIRENQPAFCGLSAKAMRRRSRRYGRCIGCGKDIHQGKCKLGNTRSQQESTYLMRMGAIRLACSTENLFRTGTVVHDMILEDFDYIKQQTGLEPEVIRDDLVARYYQR
jgi:Viral nucleic acid binding